MRGGLVVVVRGSVRVEMRRCVISNVERMDY